MIGKLLELLVAWILLILYSLVLFVGVFLLALLVKAVVNLFTEVIFKDE